MDIYNGCEVFCLFATIVFSPSNTRSFPIREYGMNGLSQPLQEHEIRDMKSSPEIMARVLRSYKLMLSFYGMTLVDESTGLCDRSEYEIGTMHSSNNRGTNRGQSRYRNLVRT